MSDERTPLLQSSQQASASSSVPLGDPHFQFCHLVGTRPLTLPPDQNHTPHPESLYHRAVTARRSQSFIYIFTATFTNTLILTQVVLGAALTGLGASGSSHVLITIFGALNTVIAGLIAFLKSRGQPMRAKMFKEDLERVVDEIENSAVMWLGISKSVHGYDAIDTDDEVTVRSEVARLTRLYDKAVKTNTLNDPDMYSTGAPPDPHVAALRSKGGPAAAAVPDASAAEPPAVPVPVVPEPDQDPDDDSPATKAPEPAKDNDITASVEDKSAESSSALDSNNVKDKGNTTDGTSKAKDDATQTNDINGASESTPPQDVQKQKPESTPAAASVSAPADPDQSPATAAHLK